MKFFQFTLYLGIISLLFGLVWKWVVILPFLKLKLKQGVYVLKVVGIYFLVSLSALLTLTALQGNSSIFRTILFLFVALLILYLNLAHYDIEAWEKDEKESKYFIPVLIGSILLYFVMLFIHALGIGLASKLIFNFIDWIYHLPIINWILKIGGGLFLLLILWHGILVLFGLLEGFTKKQKINNG